MPRSKKGSTTGSTSRTTAASSAPSTYSMPAGYANYGAQPTAYPYSLASMLSFISNHAAIIFMMLVMFVAGFAVGSLWTEVQFSKKQLAAGVPAAGTGAAPAAPAAPTGPTADQLKKAPKVTDQDHVKGNKNAKITLIEYSDFECPFCAKFHPTVNQIMEEYGDKVKLVYRHYPLSFHPNAQKAAEASECAAKQKGADGFWKYADRMFEEQDKLGGRLSAETAKTVAGELGLDMTAFQKCLDSGEMAGKVSDQMAGGSTAGITGTPGTIILTEDGKAELIPGALPFEQVKLTLEQYL